MAWETEPKNPAIIFFERMEQAPPEVNTPKPIDFDIVVARALVEVIRVLMDRRMIQ